MQSAAALSPLVFRRLEHGERSPVLELFRALSERSRYLRFLGPKPVLPERDLERLVDVGCCGREAVAAFTGEEGRAVGLARFVRDAADRSVAEIAFAVGDEWQGRGLGRLLVRELAELAAAQGITRFSARVHPSNAPALALLRGLGHIERSGFVDGLIELEVEVSPRAGTFADRSV